MHCICTDLLGSGNDSFDVEVGSQWIIARDKHTLIGQSDRECQPVVAPVSDYGFDTQRT
jgi:hypothetical protein